MTCGVFKGKSLQGEVMDSDEDDEDRKRKYNMTQRKCLERTGKQVVVQRDRDRSTCGDPTLRNAAFRKYCQQPGDGNNQSVDCWIF